MFRIFCILCIFSILCTIFNLCIPYSWKIWRGIKFGGLAVCLATAKLKFANISYLHQEYSIIIEPTFSIIYSCLHIIRVAIPYRTAKFKSANIFAMAIRSPTAKFNSRQYFRVYGILCILCILHSLFSVYSSSLSLVYSLFSMIFCILWSVAILHAFSVSCASVHYLYLCAFSLSYAISVSACVYCAFCSLCILCIMSVLHSCLCILTVSCMTLCIIWFLCIFSANHSLDWKQRIHWKLIYRDIDNSQDTMNAEDKRILMIRI